MKTKEQTLFVGVDVHKDTHTAVVLSPFGEQLGEMTVSNREKDFRRLTTLIRKTGRDTGLAPRFGLEDCTNYGGHLACYLHEQGFPVVQVSPVLVDRQRRNATHPEKSDSLDALGVATVMSLAGDSLPVYRVTETVKKARALREVSVEREALVREQTRVKNQLHRLLHRIWHDYEKQFKDPFSQKALRYWSHCRPNHDPYVTAHMKRRVRRLRGLQQELAQLEDTLTDLLVDNPLQNLHGCGTVLAAVILGEIGDSRRFRSPGALAKYAGCAPREHSSGRKTRHRKSRSGNRRLNYALYRLALSQIARSGNNRAKTYFTKKIREGKSKQQSLSCLRRKLVNTVWVTLRHHRTS